MIIVKLQGGLGNQLFQYAAGRALALKGDVPLLLDHAFLERNNISRDGFTPRCYGLDVFNISCGRLTTEIIDHYFDSNPDGIMYNYTELPVSYDRSFKKLPSAVYLTGNWQSPKYFENISAQLRKELTFKPHEFDKYYRSVLDEILTNNSVAVHVRRGDYIPKSGYSQIYSICDERYYADTMNYINARFSDPTFFVFSDDIKWAEEHLKFENYRIQFVYNEQRADWQDMYLMSSCKHNIIANSTFSWWAAWLNANESKTVIAPVNWFNIVPPGFNLNYLYPKGWIRM